MGLDQICNLGKAVVQIEAAMIHSLEARIDQSFAMACQHLHASKGRIIVMGVGKSGHIARKIAATFASTGSPAFFVHPGEAKHGDLGMVTANDVLLALSYSGESEEIISLLPFVKRFGIPLISLTGKPQSTLAKAATINLDVSVQKEACPLGLAPTSSTTATLVMGDALAMALLDMRGFTENDFALSHPGGSLGRRLLLTVDEIMHQGDNIPIISARATLKEALVEMTQKKLGMTTVIDANKKLVGIFTDGDVRRAFDHHPDLATPINQLMSTNPKRILSGLLAAEALHIMQTHQITALVIIDPQHYPIGVLHIHDLLRAGVI
ncbi:MAG: D-arabinose 5-phosphate isomerase [Gammaproteobacteria bacterium RIFCSPHIGHO2_12_FULL_43_28]|nr:MAG: D-arabinose 5-phosphate isomerase [Gammaproteobacteria bacterium RIFCSPHIGHO2_12_FULL_43_28]